VRVLSPPALSIPGLDETPLLSPLNKALSFSFFIMGPPFSEEEGFYPLSLASSITG